jgi:hypothetical protein
LSQIETLDSLPDFKLKFSFFIWTGEGALDGMTEHILQGQYNELIVAYRHENRDDISHGPGSAKVGLRRGDSHFWVIRCQKFNGVVCFLI